jgi:hypothetical protein
MVMRQTIPLRRDWTGRLMRACVAWLTLLAVALPGFAAVRGLCCEPGLKKNSDCCAAAMTMPGMDSSGMGSMVGVGIDADYSALLTSTDCAPALESEIPAYLARSESGFDGTPLLTREIHCALVLNMSADASSSATFASVLVEGRPPRVSLPDSLSTILRI